MYGNHQTLKNMTEADSIREETYSRVFGYEMTEWNTESDGLYEGIKISYPSGSKLYAPFDCKITDVDAANHKITLRKDDVMYWYDGTGGTKRDTEVYLANADLTGSLANGDSICNQIHNDSLKFAVKAVKQVIDLVDQVCSGVSRGIACPSFRFSECRTEIQAKGSIHCHGGIVQHSNEICPNVHDC